MARLITRIGNSRTVLGMNRRNVELVAKRNPRKYFPMADDKLLTKKVLAAANVPTPPTLAVYDSFIDVKNMDTNVQWMNDCVVKPSRGSGGRGIMVIAGKHEKGFLTAGGNVVTAEELRRHIADIVFGVYSLDKADRAYVEPRLMPSPLFAALYPEGLSDMRLFIVDGELVLCMIRIPTAASDGKANLHQGALGLAVDTGTGVTYRAWYKRSTITRHPDTQEPLLNRVIPQWSEIVDIGKRVARGIPLGFLGVDVVVDRELGPLVLEINARPGIEIQNVTGVPLGQSLLEKGLMVAI